MEIWKDIEGYHGFYKISNKGKIISLARKGVKKERTLSLSKDRNGYIIAILSKIGKSKQYALHRILYQSFKGELIHGMVIDHIDNNKLNNNLCNLQQISIRLNGSKDRINGSSKYVGVSWCKRKLKWRTTIVINKKHNHVGYFINEIEAHNAYQLKLSQIEN